MKTVIFDQGGVLVWTRWENVAQPWAELTGMTSDQVMRKIIEGDAYQPFMMGEISRSEFCSRVNDSIGLALSDDEIAATWSNAIEPNLEINFLVESLVGKARLAIGSNTDELHQAKGHAVQPVLKHFTDLVLSYEIGVLKPDPQFFIRALDILDTDPGQCFFTDDRHDNVDAALSVGIQAVRFQAVDQLAGELEKFGLL